MRKILLSKHLGGLGLALIILGAAAPVSAYNSYFNARCSGCHSDDTATCDGCHQHRGELSAMADMVEYTPGSPVLVTLQGGTRGGWIRALLYDDQNKELDRASGPTGTGDDDAGDPVLFPVTLYALAPLAPGEYTWEAAWSGGQSDGSGHEELRTPVTIRVISTPTEESSWSRIKLLY